jgi:hypothetical protein
MKEKLQEFIDLGDHYSVLAMDALYAGEGSAAP